MRDSLVRQRLVYVCQELAGRGYLAGTGGNVAIRIDTEHFAVTPSATDYESMQAVDVCVMQLADLRQVDGDMKPSVETSLHARVLRLRPDCACSIHTHQPLASACALLADPLEVDDPAQRELLGAAIPIVGYAPSGTGWLADKLARALRPAVNAYLMRNHGALCCGRDVTAAVRAVEALEDLAAAHLRRLIAGRADASPAQLRVLQALHAPVAPAP
jgi:L-fuculose-phosphate aldolase